MKSVLVVVTVVLVVGCKEGGGSAAKSDATTIACWVAAQDRCKELPAANAQERTALAGECSSASGALSTPAACPTAGFVGKCTVGTEVRRWYKAGDAAYQQDFCVNTAKGAWSASF